MPMHDYYHANNLDYTDMEKSDMITMEVQVSYMKDDSEYPYSVTYRVEGEDTKACLNQALDIQRPLVPSGNLWVSEYRFIGDSGKGIYSVSMMDGGAVYRGDTS